MDYVKSRAYQAPHLLKKIMGPNPVKLAEELLLHHRIPPEAVVCDLGSGQGLSSVFLAKEYGFTVYAADLWSDPADNQRFFDEMGVPRSRLIPVKADAAHLHFDPGFFDAVVSVDSYHYFGRDPRYLDEGLLPCLKSGGYVYLAVPGMRRDCHGDLPSALLRSWTPEQLDTLHDAAYWRAILAQCRGAEVLEVREMDSHREVWDDWLAQDNEYAAGDRRAMEAGGGAYLNFISMVLQKK